MAEIGIDIEKAAQLLKNDDVVAVPTEAVYGLAGNALHKSAVTRIFAVKDRPQFDPLIVHVADLMQAKDFVIQIPGQARILADEFWPGPLALLLKKKKI